MKHPTVLVILDGYGIGKPQSTNPVYAAKKPHLDAWFRQYPHAELKAAGTAVGLPAGYIGNSEVGHLTIGSGRIVDQPITLLNQAISRGELQKNSVLKADLTRLKKSGKKLHCMGLLSDAGVHSNAHHLYALLEIAATYEITEIIVHPFLDGRDVAAQSAPYYLAQLEDVLAKIPRARIGSIHGRFYAMDRDNHWQRTEQSYTVLTRPQSTRYTTWRALLDEYYAKGVTDEFIPPTQHSIHDIITDGDGIIFFNTRSDRARQLTACFVQEPFTHFERTKIREAFFLTPFSFGEQFHTDVLFERTFVYNTLLDTLAAANKRIYAIAETEKYAHITYFFNGNREDILPHEKRVLIKSIDVGRNYTELPCMEAAKITQQVIASLQEDPYDFYLINYANADMLGHSGDFNGIVQAIECLDKELGTLYNTVVECMNGTLYITADHGNAEKSFDGSVKALTAHTTNPVPFIMIQKKLYGMPTRLPLQGLADVAPFILRELGLPVPKEMKH